MNLVLIDQDGEADLQGVRSCDTVRQVCVMVKDHYQRAGFVFPWVSYLVVEDGVCVGSCSFKTAPKNGCVEIAYFTFPGHEGRGIATRMAKHLIGMAREIDASVIVTARTLMEKNASVRVLAKCGFEFNGIVEDPDDGQVWEWKFPHQEGK